MTPACRALNLAFFESQQKVSEGLIEKKFTPSNAYYGKIPDGERFPLRSGTQIKGQRLGRMAPPENLNFKPVVDDICNTNACDDEAQVVSNGGSEFVFSLVKFALKTDWLCLDSIALRDQPEAEVRHLEDGLRKISRYVHEEFRRSRFLHFTRNKMVTILPEDGDTGLPEAADVESCDGNEILNNGWLFEQSEDDEIDPRFVRVCVDPTKIGLVGALSMDNLDFAAERLGYEDEAYMDNTGLFDVLLAGQRIGRQLVLDEDDILNNAVSQGGHNIVDLRQNFGTQKVIRNYSLRSDIHAMRFFPDVDFNTALLAGVGYAFDENDPNTWPRFVRVFPYRKIRGGSHGIDHVVNANYLKAPFGISTILNPRVMSVMSFPEVTGFGTARKGDSVSYDGAARWLNPDWPCNEDRNKGFWKLHFRMAAKPNLDEEGYSWFHRLNNGTRLKGVTCAVPERVTYSEVTPYCYQGTSEDDESIGGNQVNEVG